MSSKHSTYDASTVLEDGAAAITSTENGTALDLWGQATGNAGVGAQLPDNAVVEVNVSALDTADADETYNLQLQVSTDSGFSSPVAINQRDVTATGKFKIPVTNEVNGTRYRYMRIVSTLGGTTPSITFTAYLSKE